MTDCDGHAGLPSELRAVALLALDRVTPVLEQVRAAERPASPSCTSCPVCAVLAALRGERSELAVRLADQAAELVTLLRAALLEHPAPAPSSPPAPARPVQHIRVERVRGDRC